MDHDLPAPARGPATLSEQARPAGPGVRPGLRRQAAGAASWALGIAAGVTYAEVPFEALLGFPLDPSRSLLSDLDAAGQGTQPLFLTLEILSGLLMVALAVMLWPRARGWLERCAIGMLAALGAISVADAAVPLPCSHTNGTCGAAGFEAAASGGGATIAHSVTSVGASVLGLAFALALGLVALGAWGSRRRPAALIGWTWGVAVALIAASIALSWYLTLPTSPLGYAPGTGWAQRAQAIIAGLGIVLVVPLMSGPGAGMAARHPGESRRAA